MRYSCKSLVISILASSRIKYFFQIVSALVSVRGDYEMELFNLTIPSYLENL